MAVNAVFYCLYYIIEELELAWLCVDVSCLYVEKCVFIYLPINLRQNLADIVCMSKLMGH